MPHYRIRVRCPCEGGSGMDARTGGADGLKRAQWAEEAFRSRHTGPECEVTGGVGEVPQGPPVRRV